MIDLEIVSNLNSDDRTMNLRALEAILRTPEIAADEAEIIVQILVPFFKSRDILLQTKANEVFGKILRAHPGTTYPPELLNSTVSMEETKEKLAADIPPAIPADFDLGFLESSTEETLIPFLDNLETRGTGTAELGKLLVPRLKELEERFSTGKVHGLARRVLERIGKDYPELAEQVSPPPPTQPPEPVSPLLQKEPQAPLPGTAQDAAPLPDDVRNLASPLVAAGLVVWGVFAPIMSLDPLSGGQRRVFTYFSCARDEALLLVVLASFAVHFSRFTGTRSKNLYVGGAILGVPLLAIWTVFRWAAEALALARKSLAGPAPAGFPANSAEIITPEWGIGLLVLAGILVIFTGVQSPHPPTFPPPSGIVQPEGKNRAA